MGMPSPGVDANEAHLNAAERRLPHCARALLEEKEDADCCEDVVGPSAGGAAASVAMLAGGPVDDSLHTCLDVGTDDMSTLVETASSEKEKRMMAAKVLSGDISAATEEERKGGEEREGGWN